MKFMDIMADTTISVSKDFHDWLKGKGRKGESYEDVIRRMLKPEFLRELGSKTSDDDSGTPDESETDASLENL